MKMFRFSLEDSQEIGPAIAQLQEAKDAINKATKADKAAKETIRRILFAKRQLVIDSLPEKETVIVELTGLVGGLKIDRRGSDRFNLESFRVSHPELDKAFTKRTVASYFEPLT